MTPTLRIIALLSGLLLAGTATAADNPAPPTHEYRLDNGLKLIVREDHRAPVVVSQIWYRVGSSDEHSGITGISHALEHMMFKGTKKHPPGEFSRIIAAHGGRENAFTGRDYTAYFQQLEASRLPISLELEADRMTGLTLPADEFAKEIEVVKEERRLRTEDNPQALAWEQLYAAAFTASAYGHPIVGWMNDLDHLTVDDLRNWYASWYGPDNATLVVVGDVDPEAVAKRVRRHFGRIKARRSEPLAKPRLEPPQRGERRVTVRAPAQVPWVAMGYKVPVLRTAEDPGEAYALEVLAGILSGGSSARLERRLVREERIAAGASAGYNLYARHDDLLILAGTPATGREAETLEAALRAEIARLRESEVGPAELERVKAQVVAGNVYERDSVFYQAMVLGMLETVGLDWRLMDRYVESVQAVTATQVRAVARKYLTDDRLTVSILEPAETEETRHAH